MRAGTALPHRPVSGASRTTSESARRGIDTRQPHYPSRRYLEQVNANE